MRASVVSELKKHVGTSVPTGGLERSARKKEGERVIQDNTDRWDLVKIHFGGTKDLDVAWRR
jgi:hypothetical protein